MNPSVLIVDDEVTFLDSARRKLRMAGYDSVTTEADPVEALAGFDGGTFDVAFLDVTMPGMNGLELLERILERSPATRCVMVTAVDNIDSVMRATRLGAFDYLVKPLRPEQLVDALERNRFDSIWCSERASGPMPDPMVALAFAAGRTTKLKLGTSVQVLPGRNPVLLAKQWAALDVLSGGRALPAFGLGIVDPVEQQALLARGKALARRGRFPKDASGMRYPWPLL